TRPRTTRPRTTTPRTTASRRATALRSEAARTTPRPGRVVRPGVTSSGARARTWVCCARSSSRSPERASWPSGTATAGATPRRAGAARAHRRPLVPRGLVPRARGDPLVPALARRARGPHGRDLRAPPGRRRGGAAAERGGRVRARLGLSVAARRPHEVEHRLRERLRRVGGEVVAGVRHLAVLARPAEEPRRGGPVRRGEVAVGEAVERDRRDVDPRQVGQAAL